MAPSTSIVIVARVEMLSSDVRHGSVTAKLHCSDARCRALRIRTIVGISTLAQPVVIVEWFEGFENGRCAASLHGRSEIPIATPLPLPTGKRHYQDGSPATVGLHTGKRIVVTLSSIAPIRCR